MKKQISKFCVHQTSKVLSLIYFFISFVIVVPVSGWIYYTTKDPMAFLLFIYPIIGTIVYYFFTAIMLWFYNRVASSFGGIEFDLNDK